MQNWPAVRGNGFSNSGPAVSGIPATQFLWEDSTEAKGVFPDMDDYVLWDDRLAFVGGHYNIACRSLSTGQVNWLIRQETAVGSPITNGRYLIIEPLVIDVATGQVVLDYSGCVEDYAPTRDSWPSCNSRLMVKQWRESSNDASLLVIDLAGFSARRIPAGVYFPWLVGETSHVIGPTNEGIARVDVQTGEMLWRMPIPGLNPAQGAAVSLFEETAITLTAGTPFRFYAFSPKTGKLINSFTYADIARRLVGRHYSSAYADRHYYAYGSNDYPHLVAYDYVHGTVLFDKPIADLHHSFCIAGDLLFLIRDLKDQSNYNESELIALDRFTGEQVWRADDPFPAAYSVKACGNKIVFSSTIHFLRCYQWSEPYVSPSRDRVGLKVVK